VSGGERYASIPERIAWTPVDWFHCPTDKAVLEVLATFADFRTGRGRPLSGPKLMACTGMKRRTLYESLARLVAGQWVKRRQVHRHETSFDIQPERLAPTWIQAQLVVPDKNLSAGYRTQEGQPVENLSAGYRTQAGDLSAVHRTPVPCTDLPLVAGSSPEPGVDESPVLTSAPGADFPQADKKLQVVPVQPSLLPPEVSDEARLDSWGHVVEALRDGLKRTGTGSD
jgi:hypothetical protein